MRNGEYVARTVETFMVIVLVVLLTTGCVQTSKPNGSELSAKDKAIVAGYEMANAYQELYASFVHAREVLRKSGRAIPPEVPKTMNMIKRSIVSYNDAVILWVQTGQDPGGMEDRRADIVRMISDLTAMLINLGVM